MGVISDEVERARVLALLRRTEVFGRLEEAASGWLLDRAQLEDVPAGQVLGREGDPADAMYLVISGQLEASVHRGAEPQRLRRFRRGEVVGVLSMLSEKPRMGILRAVRDARVLRVDQPTFAQLLRTSASFGEALARTFAGVYARARTSVLRPIDAQVLEPPAPVRSLALVQLGGPSAAGVPTAAFARTLARWGSVIVVDRAPGRGVGESLDRALEIADYVLLLAHFEEAEEQAQETIKQADEALVFIRADAAPPSERIIRALRGCNLVFVLDITAKNHIAEWLEVIRSGGHHLLDASDSASLRRLVRRAIGRSLGIVLSGGGARGFAHIGVLDALERRDIEIDRIGGCSMGAFVGAMYAKGVQPGEIEDHCAAEFVRRKPFADYTVPRVALIRAERAKSMLRRTFGDRMIETTPIDFYCVSADLLTAETIVHRRGPLYLAVGASMSLPGLAPPVRYGNRLLVDGGVLDNLPIDVMAARSEGDIIAVDVMRRISSERSPDPTPAIPSILETLTRSTALGSWSLGVRASTYAALTISPTLGDVGTFEWRSLPKIVELGREAAEKALSEQDTAPWTLPMGVQQVTWWTA